MKLFTFGDSWTEGVGGCLEEEYTTNISEERTIIRQKYCWPNVLSKLIGIDYINFGIGACSNKTIFDAVCESIDNKTIQKNDLVVIMWSSSLRDDVPFFPSNNLWHFWSERYIVKKFLYQKVFGDKPKTDEYNRIKKEYQEYFLSNLYSDSYYNIVNQNYILYLQFMFEKIGIRYVFCDAFDFMVKSDIIKDIDKTYLINKLHYWEFSQKTIRDFLININKKDIWEDGLLWNSSTIAKHPSKNGYELIANLLYDYILKNNILYYNTNNIESRLI